MLLAAGRGERMRPLTDKKPKVLLDIGGQSLIERNVRLLAAAGVETIVVNLSYRGPQLREHLGDGRRFGLQILYTEEGEPPLETGGGIVNALDLLGPAPFLLVNGDVVTDFDFSRLERPRALGTLVLVPNPGHHPEGDFAVDAHGCVRQEGSRYTFAGVSILDPALFASCVPGRQPLKPILDAAIADGALDAIVHSRLWIDVGTPQRLEDARRTLSPTAAAQGK